MEIKKSKNYDSFHFIGGNRNVKNGILTQLRKSHELYGQLVQPIIVNENGGIVDGQHRYTIWKELGLDIIYHVQKGYTDEQAQALNVSGKNWGSDDFLAHFVGRKEKQYIMLQDFCRQYSMPLYAAQVICQDSDIGGSDYSRFKNGNFKCDDWERAYAIAEEVSILKQVYKGVFRRGFVKAYMEVREIPGFNPKYFYHKMNNYGHQIMEDRSSIEQYRELIHEVYNFNSRKENRLMLKPF